MAVVEEKRAEIEEQTIESEREVAEAEVVEIDTELSEVNVEVVDKPVVSRKAARVADLTPERIAQSTILTAEEVPDAIVLDSKTEVEVEQEVDNLVVMYRGEINAVMQKVAVAVRSGDRTALALAKKQVAELREEILATFASDADSTELTSFIDNRLSRELARLKVRTEAAETLIKERVETDLSKDSDQDGITDFDEINLYQTDPLVADSDNDGFTDGIEILSGYDPRDASVEAVVEYESPKEAGVVREDILVVESITTLTPPNNSVNETQTPEAVISGRALPNSFVTLFVFSNPVVVTVKTDAEGNWSYKFDKEIEDGTHEVYVGVTDNAGRVVAKSEPVRFVKTAEAFTPVDAAEETFVGQTETNTTLINSNSVLMIASISVVAIGVILIMLGLHLQGRREERYDFGSEADPVIV